MTQRAGRKLRPLFGAPTNTAQDARRRWRAGHSFRAWLPHRQPATPVGQGCQGNGQRDVIGGVGHQQGVMGVERAGSHANNPIHRIGPTEGMKAVADVDGDCSQRLIMAWSCPASPKGRITMMRSPLSQILASCGHRQIQSLERYLSISLESSIIAVKATPGDLASLTINNTILVNARAWDWT